MPFLSLDRVPYDSTILGPKGQADDTWLTWFRTLHALLQQVVRFLVPVVLTLQSAAIAIAPIPMGASGSGRYRITYYARITRPATTSSSLAITLLWTDAVACAVTGAAIVLNATNAVQGGTVIVEAAASSLKYATAYASIGAQAMQYKLTIWVEAV